MRNCQDEELERVKEKQMRGQMESLEEEFGYREFPIKTKPNLLKQADDVFGVQLSIQYRKALEGKASEEGESLTVVEERKNSQAYAKGHF